MRSARSSYAPNGYVSGTSNPPGPQGKARIPADFSDGASNTILHAEKYARCSNTYMAPPFQDGGNAWAYCTALIFSWQPPPMVLPGKAYQPGFAIAALASRGAPDAVGPGSKFQGPAHAVSGQLRSDADLDLPPRRNPGRPGRRQRPVSLSRREPRNVVVRRHARGGRDSGFRLVKNQETGTE